MKNNKGAFRDCAKAPSTNNNDDDNNNNNVNNNIV